MLSLKTTRWFAGVAGAPEGICDLNPRMQENYSLDARELFVLSVPMLLGDDPRGEESIAPSHDLNSWGHFPSALWAP